jgi:hypothetical protein
MTMTFPEGDQDFIAFFEHELDRNGDRCFFNRQSVETAIFDPFFQSFLLSEYRNTLFPTVKLGDLKLSQQERFCFSFSAKLEGT